MPTISNFYGILIQMYWKDHQPPHFHAIYGSFEALIKKINNYYVLEYYQSKQNFSQRKTLIKINF